MALPRLHFSGSWENPADFPTHEYSETQVRKDIMRLFAEIQTYLNRALLPLLESGGYSAGSGTGGSGGGGGAYLPLAGGDMTGPLLLADNPVLGLEAATKQYVDETGGLIRQGMNDAIAAVTVELGRIQAAAADGYGNVTQLTLTPDQAEALVQNTLGDIASLTLSAEQVQALIRNALGDQAQISMTPEEIDAFVLDTLGNLSRIIQNAGDIQALAEDIAGNTSSLTLTAEEVEALVTDNMGNFTQILQTSEELRQSMEDSLGNASRLNLTPGEISALVSGILGTAAQTDITGDEIRAAVRGEFNAMALLDILSDRIQLLVSEAAKQAGINITADDVSIMVRDALSAADFSVLSDAIAARVSTNEGNIASLQVTAAGLTSRVESAEGSISQLRQGAEGIEARVANNEGNITSLQVKASGITSRVEGAEGSISQLRQTADSIETRVGAAENGIDGLEGQYTSIAQTVSGITLRTYRDGTDAAIELLVPGQAPVTGKILMTGNVDVSGELSAEALYAAKGEIANLAVDQFSTSRRIVAYLAHNTADDNYLRAYNECLEFVTGHCTGAAEQAKTPDGKLLYWEQDITGYSTTSDGYPVVEGLRINTTTTPTNYAVTVYRYTEEVKLSIRFQTVGGIYTPVITLGAGNASGWNRGQIVKSADGLDIKYTSNNAGKEVGIRMTTDGYVDITGLRHTTGLNFSGWNSGSFSETVEGRSSPYGYGVSLDDEGRPLSITDRSSGRTLAIQW